MKTKETDLSLRVQSSKDNSEVRHRVLHHALTTHVCVSTHFVVNLPFPYKARKLDDYFSL